MAVVRDLSGTQLGPYELRRVVSHGSNAIVYEGYQSSLNRVVAVKVLSRASDEAALERFKLEARSIASLDHPNILPIYDHGEQDDVLFVVAKYVEDGRTLADLTGQPVALERAVKLVDCLLAALEHAHRQGVVHRDIKPANVLLSRSEWPLLADFGIAKVLQTDSQLTAPGMVMGTPAYFSPEQCLGRDVDGRTDLYSAGVVLYELLTGRTPFSADTAESLMVQVAYSDPPPPRELNPDVSFAVEEFLQRALAKDPEQRFQDAASMRVALNALPATVPAIAPAVPTVANPVPAVVDLAAAEAASSPGPAAADSGPGTGGPGTGGPGSEGSDTELMWTPEAGRQAAAAAVAEEATEMIAPRRRRRADLRRQRPIGAGLLAAGVIAVVFLGAQLLRGQLTGDDLTSVLLEPASATGPEPFRQLATAPAPVVVRRQNVGSTPSGKEPGLYGEAGDPASCDVAQLAGLLSADTAKAGAWVSSLNSDPTLRWGGGAQIRTDQITDYLSELTAVSLRHDTRVTNGGYHDGRAAPRQAVLEAGTAVLVDQYGVPRSRCMSGTPLATPARQAGEPTYSGRPWNGFDPVKVVTVVAADEPQMLLVVADAQTGALETFRTGSRIDPPTEDPGIGKTPDPGAISDGPPPPAPPAPLPAPAAPLPPPVDGLEIAPAPPVPSGLGPPAAGADAGDARADFGGDDRSDRDKDRDGDRDGHGDRDRDRDDHRDFGDDRHHDPGRKYDYDYDRRPDSAGQPGQPGRNSSDGGGDCMTNPDNGNWLCEHNDGTYCAHSAEKGTTICTKRS